MKNAGHVKGVSTAGSSPEHELLAIGVALGWETSDAHLAQAHFGAPITYAQFCRRHWQVLRASAAEADGTAPVSKVTATPAASIGTTTRCCMLRHKGATEGALSELAAF